MPSLRARGADPSVSPLPNPMERSKMDETEDKLLSGAAAAEFLGVKPATLYAYASRGQIESIAAGGRERSYRLSELLKLRNSNRGVKAAKDDEIPVWTGPLIKSSITEICSAGHKYRGEDAIEKANNAESFESVAELLWETDEEPALPWQKAKPFSIPKQLKRQAAAESDFLDLLKLLLVSIEIEDPLTRKLLSDNLFEGARRLIATMAVTAGLFAQRETYIMNGPFPIAQTLLMSLTGSKSRQKSELINAALVLCADHELNASALAARIAASCDASLFSCLLSALGTFSGTMHGAASRRTEDLVVSSLQFKNASSWLKDYMKHSEKIPGFGSDLYASGDPRARFLIDAAKSLNSRNKTLGRLIELVDCVSEQLGTEANLDVGLAAISYALNLPSGSGTAIFAVSRTAGWIAHAIEQRMYGGLIRPRAKYIGKV